MKTAHSSFRPSGQELVVQPGKGTAIEVKLDAPDGKLIGELPFGQATCPIQRQKAAMMSFLCFLIKM